MSASLAAQSIGLFAAGQPVPLTGVSVEVFVEGAAARVEITQHYRNNESTPIEAVYTFPLSEDAAVCGFEAEIGECKIRARIEEREAAFEQYDEALSAGHGAYLLDQDRPNIFTASLGNVPAGAEVCVRIQYVSELSQIADRLRLLIPTTVSPRYFTADQIANGDPAELDHLAPPVAVGDLPYGLSLRIEFRMAADIREISCASHPARVTLNGRRAVLELAGSDIRLDRDVVVEVVQSSAFEPSSLTVRDSEGARWVMLNFFPDPQLGRRAPCEFLYVIDCSGSMAGQSIAQARAALQLCLRSMEAGDFFNIVRFGSNYDSMFPGPVAYSQASVDEATRRIDSMQADLGGTELSGVLRDWLSKPVAGELPRNVILLTDGQVANEVECQQAVARATGKTRVFSFGIGEGVSEHLVRSLARVSGGQAEFIHPYERMEPRILRQFERMSAVGLTDIQVDFQGLEIDQQVPAVIGSLFPDERLTVYARVKQGTPGKVTLRASHPDGPREWPVVVDIERPVESDFVLKLMARALIRQLEEDPAELAGSAQTKRRQSAVRKRILETSIRHQVLSSVTSFVAVEERAVTGVVEPAQLRRVPIQLTKGVRPEAVSFGYNGVTLACAAPPPAARMMRHADLGLPGSQRSFAAPSSGVDDTVCADLPCMSPPAMDDGCDAFFPEDDFVRLVRCQEADGRFEPSSNLSAASGLDARRVDQLQLPGLKKSVRKTVIATALAVWTFERVFAARRDEWNLIVKKSRRWLKSQGVNVDALLTELTAIASNP